MSYIYPIDKYPFLYKIQDAWEDILGEFNEHVKLNSQSGMMDMPGLIWPWPEKHLYNQGWKAVGLIYKGRDDFRYTQEVKKHFPITNKLVMEVPGVYIAGFSILEPKTKIYPHTGYTKDVYRSHLGLITPKGAYLEVAGEKVEWEQGKMFVFDDMVTHNAYNGSDEERVILMVDFYK
jgi:beta-hydroxylase